MDRRRKDKWVDEDRRVATEDRREYPRYTVDFPVKMEVR